MKLTKAQLRVLDWLSSQPNGVFDITDERSVSRLVERGMVLKFFETEGSALRPVWTITEAGRAALSDEVT
jgi:hypothetical protein